MYIKGKYMKSMTGMTVNLGSVEVKLDVMPNEVQNESGNGEGKFEQLVAQASNENTKVIEVQR